MRSRSWFQPVTAWGTIHRAWMMAQGYSQEVFDGRPVVGICNSWSELTNCNSNLRQLAEAVKRGVWRAGGFPLEFPTISLGEPFMKPTTMLFRNLMSMDVEECIEANPVDSVVLLAGCDKTTPAQIMGALSANIPAIQLTSGPMLRSNIRGRELGSGHDVMDYVNEYHAGMITREGLCEIESCISRSTGHCMVMGTASTMACISEALGFMLPGAASIPGPDSRRLQLAEQTGARAVELAQSNRKPRDIITPAAIRNAIRVLHAIGGSTNAVIHLTAFARRIGYVLPLEVFDKLGRDTPMIVNVMPSGTRGMEDFHSAGGMQAVLKEIAHLLDPECLTVTGEPLGAWIGRAAPSWNRDVIRPRENPMLSGDALVSLSGTLVPRGAMIKTSAATPSLLQHRGPAFVFENYDDLNNRIGDRNLDITPEHIIVLKNGGPVGVPGMPEWGVFGVPLKLFEAGVRDIIRISDARASGTSHGTIVVHAAPEAAIGGPIGLVRTGDLIELDTKNRRLDLLVSAGELEARRKDFRPPVARTRGYKKLYVEHVLQADEGCDFDFLAGETLAPFPAA